jgi:hypothetical protein
LKNNFHPLKLLPLHTLFFTLLLISKIVAGQGRVVINEFMPWAGCNTTSEFIELMNFGPGPMDIGCYIITNGTYSVTIPPNTILQRGQYYVLSGQNTLAKNCGNADSLINVDLNWNACNCTNTSIPTSGDGFMQNGGNANEKVVLLDPNLNVIDAVSTNIPVSSSVSITTPAISGGCGSKTFNLGTMGISYETTGPATGNNNSIARRVDGDCGWVKTTAISAHAPNKTGSSASASYDFSTVSTTQCNAVDGSISIQVNSSDVAALFPMNYTLAYDVDGNYLFDANDQYTYGVDNTSPSIDIGNLAYGRYRVTVASSSSCNLKSFDFYVFNCYTVILPVKLLYFTYSGTENEKHLFRFKIEEASTLSNVVLEGGDGSSFQPVATLYGPFDKNEFVIRANVSAYSFYRLKMTNQTGIVFYSKEIKVPSKNNSAVCWPNPVQDKIYVRVKAMSTGKLVYKIVNSNGAVVTASSMEVSSGESTLVIPAKDLTKGMYYLQIAGTPLPQPVSSLFIK